jgi:hypothetical protein
VSPNRMTRQDRWLRPGTEAWFEDLGTESTPEVSLPNLRSLPPFLRSHRLTSGRMSYRVSSTLAAPSWLHDEGKALVAWPRLGLRGCRWRSIVGHVVSYASPSQTVGQSRRFARCIGY